MENLVYVSLQSIVLIGIALVGLFLIVMFVMKIVGRRIETPIVQKMIDLLGVYYLDNSEIPTKFRSINRILGDKFRSDKLILMSGVHDFNVQSLDKHSVTYINEAQLKINTSINSICLSVESASFLAGNFESVAKMIKYYRNQIPINGMILTFAIDQLANISDEDLDNITKQLVNFNGFPDYPIYLVFDRLSNLPGFSSFKQLMSDEPDVVIGYTDDGRLRDKTSYTNPSNITADVVSYVHNALNRLIDIKLLRTNEQVDTKELVLFVAKVTDSITSRLTHIITKLFYNNSNSFLRGIYLCDSGTGLFCKNLFLNLIFADNLIKATNFSIRSFMVRNLFVFILLCLILSLPFTSQKLTKKSLAAAAALGEIKSMSNNQNAQLVFHKLIDNIKKVTNNIPSSILIPLSWFDYLPSKLRSVIMRSYRELFINRFYTRYNDFVIEVSSVSYKPTYPKVLETDLFTSSEYLDLYYYVIRITELEEIEQLILKLNKDAPIELMNDLVSRLFNLELPKEYMNHSEYFKEGLDPKLYKLESLSVRKQAIHEVFLEKLRVFLAYYRNLNGISKVLEPIRTNLALMKNETAKYSISNTVELAKAVLGLQEFVSMKKLDAAKIGTLTYSISTDQDEEKKSIKKLSDNMKRTNTFDKDFIDSFMGRLSTENTALKQEVTNLEVPIFGLIFTLENDNNFVFSKSFDGLATVLKQLNEDTLLSPGSTTTRALSPDAVGVSTMVWNTSITRELVNIIQKFNSTLKVKLDGLDGQARAYLARTVANIFGDKLQNDLTVSLEDPNLMVSSDQFGIDYRLNNMVENFQNLSSIASFAKQNQLLDLSFKLISIVVMQYEKLLTDLYAMIDQQGIYILNQNSILNPAVDKRFATNFITTSRSELSKLHEKAKPILQILSGLYKANDFLKQSEIYDKWNEIRLYFDLSADTSLEELDLFYTKLLDCKTIQSLIEFANTYKDLNSDTLASSRRVETLKLVRNKIRIYLSDAVPTLYTKVMSNFDKYLKGYFPFANISEPDLPKDRMLGFYTAWMSDKAEINSVLDSFRSDVTVSTGKEYQFLLSMTKAMKWLDHIMNPATTKYSAKVQVRDMNSAENLVDQLNDWRIAFYGQNQLVLNQVDDPVKNTLYIGIGQVGDLNCLTYSSIDMIQRISPASQYVFAKSGDQSINGLSYSSNFALLRLMTQYYHTEAQDTVYLKFQFPVITKDGSKTALLTSYMSIKLNGLEYFTFQAN